MIKTFLLDGDLVDKSKFHEEFYIDKLISFLIDISLKTRKRGLFLFLIQMKLLLKNYFPLLVI